MAGNHITRLGRALTHGYCVNGEPPPEYRAWAHMIGRCYDSRDRSFPNYGGRGITVCPRWRHSFEAFLADMGNRPSSNHSLDRYPDNNGNYEPGNVRWATAKEQMRNTRLNRRVTINGETRLLLEWAEISGIGWSTIANRIRSGWPSEKLLFKPSPANRPTRNKRTHLLTVDGVTRSITEWARLRGLNPSSVYTRIAKGWSHEQAVSPITSKFRNGKALPR